MSGSDPPQGRYSDTVVPFRPRGPRPGRPEKPSATECAVVDCRFWNDPQVQALPPTAKFVFVYLMTGPQCNMTGIYPDDPDTFAADLGITKAAYRRAQRVLVKANVLELSSAGPIKARGGRLLWVKPMFKYQGTISPKVCAFVRAYLEQFQSSPLVAAFYLTYPQVRARHPG
jgi:hypothetical protein